MTSDAQFAIDLAESTGRVLQQTRAGADPELPLKELKDLGDASAQAHIARELAAKYPDDAVLSEEADDDVARVDADRVWIIDPLDGTREYSEHRADWAVHIALWERAAGGRSGELTVGAVALPDEDLVLSSATVGPIGGGATGDVNGAAGDVNGATAGGSGGGAAGAGSVLRIAVSRSRPPAVVHEVVEALAARGITTELVPMGSAGVKIAAVVRGLADAYLHAGGQYQWDSAAPVAVARAAGAHTSRLDGSPLVYNRADTYLPDLVVCRADVAEPIFAALGSQPAETTT